MTRSVHDAVLSAAALDAARAAHRRQVAALAEAKRAQATEEPRALRALRELLAEAEALRVARRRRRIVEACCLVGLALAGVAILVLGGAS